MTERDQLAAAQERLLRAVLTGDGPPAGFDPPRVELQARMLRAKRTRILARRDPALARRLGPRFDTLADQYCRDHPGTDGTTFRRWLRRHRVLPWWTRFQR